MQRIYTQVLTSRCRLRQKSFNSYTLHTFAIFLSLVTILCLVNLDQLNQSKQVNNPVFKYLEITKTYIFLKFLNNVQYTLEQIVIVLGFFILEIVFLYLLYKKENSEFSNNLLNSINYFKLIFSFPAHAILLYALMNESKGVFIVIKILAVLTMISSTAIQYLIEFLNFTCLYIKINKNQGIYNSLSPKIKIVLKLILSYSLIKQNLSNQQLIVLMIAIVLLHLVLLVNLAINKIQKYDQTIEIANYISWIFITSFYLVQILQIYISLVKDNMWLVLISFFIWTTFAFYNIMEYFKNSLLIKSPQDIRDEKEAINFIRLLYNVYENVQGTGNSILFLGLIKHHINKCTVQECVCKKINKSSSSIFKDEQFLIQFVETNVKIITQNFQGSTIVGIASLSFYVEVMKRFPKYFYEMRSYRKQHLGLNEKYSLLQIEKQACKLLDEKSMGYSNDKSLQLYKQQQQTDQCYDKLEKALTNISNLYRFNARAHCGLNLLQKQLHSIYVIMEELQQILNDKNSQDVISIEFIILMIFFYKNVLNLTFKIKPILNRLQLIHRRLEFKELKHDNFDASMHSENGCVLQSRIDNTDFGYISNASKNAHKIFSYPNYQSMLGIDINKLLPKCQRDEHQKMIHQWIETGSFAKINKMRQTFCCSYDQNLFRCIVRIQIAIVNNQMIIFAGIIKRDGHNYLLVNNQNQIDSCGTDFLKILAGEAKCVQVSDLFPQWDALTAKFIKETKQTEKTFRTYMIPKQKNGDLYSHQSAQNCQNQQNKPIFQVVLQVNKERFGSIQYYVVKKLSQNQKSRRLTKLMLESKQFLKPAIPDNKSQEQDKKNNLKNNTYEENDKFLQQILLQNGSSSSTKSQASFFSIWRILEQLNSRFQAGEKLNYPFLKVMSIILIFVFFIIIFAVISQIFIYIKGLESYNEVIFADAAVSDNMQLLQILYNKLIMYEQYCGEKDFDLKNCNYAKQSAENIYANLYSLMTDDVRDVIRNETFFRNKYFTYEFMPVNLSISGKYYSVDTFQFMEYYVRSYRQINSDLETYGKISNSSLSIILDLKSNWNEMKRINHQNIQQYQITGIYELQLVTKYVIVMSVFSGIFISLFVGIQFSIIYRNQHILRKILQLFRFIPINISIDFLNYFEEIKKVIDKKNKMNIYNIKAIQISNSRALAHYGFTDYTNLKEKTKIIVFWFVLIFFVFLSNLMIAQYIQVCKQSFHSLNRLMDSQNYVLQNYFQLKGSFLFNPPTKFDKTYFNSLMQTLDTSEVTFVKIAMKTSQIFHQNQMKINDQYTAILVGDICNITQSLVPNQQYQKCVNGLSFKILNQGILDAMAYFQRTVFQSVFDLQEKGLNYQTYFKQLDFQNLDNYLFFMFRMYQTTQAKLIEGLNIAIQNKFTILGILVGVQIFLLTFAMLRWVLNLKNFKKQLSQTYGYALIFPIPITRQFKQIQQILCKLL